MTVDPVSHLVNQLEIADSYRRHHNLKKWRDSWSRSSVTGALATSEIDIEALSQLAGAGCRVEIKIETERLNLSSTAENSPNFAVDSHGDWADAVVDDASGKLAPLAAANSDFRRLLTLLRELPANVTITVLKPSDQFEWVRTTEAFVNEFRRSGWLEFSRLFLRRNAAAGRVVVLEAGSASLCAPGLGIHGPDTWPDVPPRTKSRGDLSDTRTDAREGTPSPDSLLPLDLDGEQLAPVDEVLRATAGALAWLWLADAATMNDGTATVRFEGNRPLVTDLPPSPSGAAAPSVALWAWVVATPQPGRRHAAIQATTLQAESATDLYRRAGSILDTAVFLFSMSQSGLIQEALSARRAARDAAVAAARSSADRVRSAARSTVDRTLVVIGAGVGVVLANKGELIGRSVAIALLALAAGLIVGAALLAFHFELPGASRTLASFESEVDDYSEVLLPRELDAIRRLPSLVDGAAEIARARRVTGAIIAVAIVALVALTVVVVPESGDTTNSPTTTATTQTPTTSTSTTATTSALSSTTSP
jgi:hypothetical protein